jgi:hypothetical protein
MSDAATIQTPAAGSSPTAAPTYPDGADLVVRTGAHDTAFWDRHPDVERYRITVQTQQDSDLSDVLIWLKPGVRLDADPVFEDGPEPPERPADFDFTFDTAHDPGFFERHPDVIARRWDLALTDHADGAVRRLRLWLKPQAERAAD